MYSEEILDHVIKHQDNLTSEEMESIVENSSQVISYKFEQAHDTYSDYSISTKDSFYIRFKLPNYNAQ